MKLSILGWLASRCARDANQRGMAEREKRINHADSDNHETVAKENPEVKRINGSTNNTNYCLLVQ